MNTFQIIAFDADDTLWHNESLYATGRERFREIMARYGLHDISDEQVDAIEIRNLPLYGYGVMSFVLSLTEAAIVMTQGRVTGRDLQALLDHGKEMLSAEVQLFEHVEETLASLSADYPLMMITKGDLQHQQAKVENSGLSGYFRHVEVVSDKSPETYARILERHGLDATRFLMVGNSLKSDILPVVQLGGWAVYIPNELTWSHEHAQVEGDGAGRIIEAQEIRRVPELVRSLVAEKLNG